MVRSAQRGPRFWMGAVPLVLLKGLPQASVRDIANAAALAAPEPPRFRVPRAHAPSAVTTRPPCSASSRNGPV
jgi:hypothetical protein